MPLGRVRRDPVYRLCVNCHRFLLPLTYLTLLGTLLSFVYLFPPNTIRLTCAKNRISLPAVRSPTYTTPWSAQAPAGRRITGPPKNGVCALASTIGTTRASEPARSAPWSSAGVSGALTSITAVAAIGGARLDTNANGMNVGRLGCLDSARGYLGNLP